MGGDPVWVEPRVGWSPGLGGDPVWVEPRFGWSPGLGGAPVWVETRFGWRPYARHRLLEKNLLLSQHSAIR